MEHPSVQRLRPDVGEVAGSVDVHEEDLTRLDLLLQEGQPSGYVPHTFGAVVRVR